MTMTMESPIDASIDTPLAASTIPLRRTSAPPWCQSTLTRVEELRWLCAWIVRRHQVENDAQDTFSVPADAVRHLLDAAEEAANTAESRKGWRAAHKAARLDGATSNLDAAEAQLLNFAPSDYVYGQLPSLLGHVQRHLRSDDPRRQEFERIARRLGITDHGHVHALSLNGLSRESKYRIINEERGRIVTAVRGASSAALREQVRVRSFRNVLVGSFIAMSLLVGTVALIGMWRPVLIPLCFAPEESGRAVVVCPTARSQPFSTAQHTNTEGERPGQQLEDVDDYIARTATPVDLLVVEFVGLTAAAVAAAAALRGIQSTAQPYAVPLWLTLLKLPTGAITAFLGLLLMRGRFVPGLSALDTPEQILAWALVFGYAQQLFTRLVDQQGRAVLDSVRGANRSHGD